MINVGMRKGRARRSTGGIPDLSTIELTILGLAWVQGPCTTYVLMKELSSAGSTFYRSRAGTAYAVVKRLVGFGLLSVEGDQVSITHRGVSALQRWLAPPVPEQDVAHSADLLRLRFYYLGVIPPADRIAYMESARESLEALVVKIESLIKESQEIDDYFGSLALASAVLETKARIRWLDLVRPWVEKPIENRDDWARTILAALRQMP